MAPQASIFMYITKHKIKFNYLLHFINNKQTQSILS